MRKSILIATAALVAGAVTVAYTRRKNYSPLSVAPKVDLKRYMGEWYEIAHFPESFEKNCYGTKAKYTLQKDGSVEVFNTCHKGSIEGDIKSIRGKATVADPNTNAKLDVQFFWPFTGDYWILDIDKDYRYALVGEPSRENLWILSRTPTIPPAVLQQLREKATRLGFDVNQFIYTEQLVTADADTA